VNTFTDQLSLEGVEHFVDGGSDQEVICLAQRSLASMSQNYFAPVGFTLMINKRLERQAIRHSNAYRRTTKNNGERLQGITV